MSITYHRLIVHKSFVCHPVYKIIGLLLGTLGLTGSALAWCSVHKEHHAFSDTKNDPHSPHFKPKLWVEFASMFHKPKLKFIRIYIKDSVVIFFHRNYFKINFVYAFVLFLIDPFAVIYAHLFPAFLLWHGGSLINVLGHLQGYRNYETQDKSRNHILLGYLMWGEGWHNNHHRNPSRADFKLRWFEVDLSYVFIRMIDRGTNRSL